MRKLTIIILAISLASCTGIGQRSDDDSVEFAVYGAYPLDAVEDLEPVYIDLGDSTAYQIGDTIEVNEHGRIPYMEMQIRDSETKQLVKPKGWHWVVLDYRDKVTKRFSRDDAEHNQ